LLPKIHRKNGLVHSALAIVLLGTLLIAIPETARAWSPTNVTDPLNLCQADNYPGLTHRIVQCVQNTILASVYRLLSGLFTHFYAALGACMTLAVAIWGILVMTGRQALPVRQGMVLAVKLICLAALFGGSGYNFLFFYGAALDMMSGLLGAVTGYVSFSSSLSCGLNPPSDPTFLVWDYVDCTINTLVGGIFANSNVSLGVGGFLLAALLSGGSGIFVALLGFLVVIQLLFAIIRAVYIYILAYVAFSLMALVAPLFLPMILFQSTRGYFEKWLKLSIGFILQPIFIFVYLTMLLAAFDTVVYTGSGSLFNVLTHNAYGNSCTPPASCTPIGGWLEANGAYKPEMRGTMSVNLNVAYSKGDENCTPQAGCSSNPLTEQTAGLENNLAEVKTSTGNWTNALALGSNYMQSSIYKALNIDDYFFHVNMPVPTIDWYSLASANGYTVDDTDPTTLQPYLLPLFTALIMAVATSYIFMQLLEKLPFIGSGIMNIGSFISGGSGMSGFGFGGLAPPGAGFIDNIQKKVMGK
jgi:TrbL/VirB6 plasmid conjugal transfer protein